MDVVPFCSRAVQGLAESTRAGHLASMPGSCRSYPGYYSRTSPAPTRPFSTPVRPAPPPPGVLLPSSNLLKDRLLRAVLCPISLLISFLPKSPNHQSKASDLPLPHLASHPNSRVDSSLTDQLLLFRHPEQHSAAHAYYCSSDVFESTRRVAFPDRKSTNTRHPPRPDFAVAEESLHSGPLCACFCVCEPATAPALGNTPTSRLHH